MNLFDLPLWRMPKKILTDIKNGVTSVLKRTEKSMIKYIKRLWCALLNKKCDVCKCKEAE